MTGSHYQTTSAEDEAHELPESESGRLAQQFLDLFVLPELTRRLEEGTLGTQFTAQPSSSSPGKLLCPTVTLAILEDNRPTRILFDEETDVELLLRLPTSRQLEMGDEVSVGEGKVVGFRIRGLPPNAGWALMINQSGQGRIAFDFRRNGRYARQHLQQTRAFLRSAKLAAGSRNSRVAIENLFHAVEKACKAELLTLPLGLRSASHEDALERESHVRLKTLYSSLGQVRHASVLYTTLASLRNPANYYLKPFRIRASKLTRLIEETEALEKAVRRRIPKASDVRPERSWI